MIKENRKQVQTIMESFRRSKIGQDEKLRHKASIAVGMMLIAHTLASLEQSSSVPSASTPSRPSAKRNRFQMFFWKLHLRIERACSRLQNYRDENRG